jgi:hypothetical protein
MPDLPQLSADYQDYDLVPVDQQPDFVSQIPAPQMASLGDAPVPKTGQTVQPVNVGQDLAAMPGKVAGAVGDVTGVSDAYKAATGQMTPEEAQMFALGAIPALAAGPEEKVAEEAAPALAQGFRNLYRGESVYNKGGNFWTTDPEWARQFTQSGLESQVLKKSINNEHIYQPLNEVYAGDPDAVDKAIADARAGGFHAVELSEGAGQPNSLFVFNKRALKPFQEPPPEAQPPPSIRAYHGSPYDFDKFDISKIGTGEGAQSYGHGLYFAENPATAQAYKENLSDAKYSFKSGEPIETGAAFGQLMNRATEVAPDRHPDIRRGVVNQVLQGIDDYGSAQKYASKVDFPEGYEPLYNAVVSKANLLGLKPHTGKMYEVNINADPEHFLDWDKPLSEQHPVVQDALNKVGGNATTLLPDAVTQGKNGRYYTMRGDQVVGRYDGWPDPDTANEAMKVMKQNAVPNYTFGEWQKKMNVPFPEEKLAQLGIPGIKYFDQGSRGYTVQNTYKGQPYSDPVKFATKQQADDYAAEQRANGFGAEAGQTGTRNYVVFDPKIINIVKKYGLAGLVAGGAAHFQTVPVDNEPDFGGQHADGGAVGGPQSSGFDDLSGVVDLTSAMAPNGIDTSDWRPSTNVEDDRGASEINKLGRNFMLNVTGQKDNWISDISNAITGRTPTPPDQVPFRARGGRIPPMLPHGLTLEYAPAPTNRWGVYDKSGTQLSTGKTEEEAVANLPRRRRADGGAVSADPYNTDLGDQEPAFRQWVKDNNVPFDPDAASPQDYDMRGFYQGLQSGDPHASSAVDPNDNRMHYSDYWKTPLHQTFSNESKWATPDAPHWNDKDQLIAPDGSVVYDDRSPKRAHGGRVEPANINPNPTAAQAKAGNYAKDHLHFMGLPLTIENAKGSIRRGVGRDGKPWQARLSANYGYIKRTVGADSDHVDVYLGPHRKAPNVFVIDQVDADSRQYDEAKVMLGFSSLKQALVSYCKAFSDGRGHERIGIITTMAMPEFKRWLERGNTTAPFAHPQSEARV